MKAFIGDTVGEVYKQVIEELLSRKPEGNGTIEIENCLMEIAHPSLERFHLPYRKMSKKYCEAELKWYWSGDNSCETIGQYAKMWLRLTDDGKTNNSAYGYILFKKYGFNQLEQIISLLKKDPNTRRALLNISDPTIDRINTKDMQCTVGIDFLNRDGELDMTVVMRSNDVFFGFPYDCVFFMSIQKYVAKRLGLRVGKYVHHSISMHMYERDIQKFIDNKDNDQCIDDLEEIVDKIIDEEYEKNF